MFNHLQFYATIYTTIFPSQQDKDYAKHLIFSLPEVNEEFYFLLQKYILSQAELKKIKDHFSVLYNIGNQKLKVSFYFFYDLKTCNN